MLAKSTIGEILICPLGIIRNLNEYSLNKKDFMKNIEILPSYEQIRVIFTAGEQLCTSRLGL